MGRSLTQEEFIEKVTVIHEGKYDYRNTIYTRSKNLISYICPVHGKVHQKAADHLSGRGCRECGRLSASSKQSLTIEEFIERAVKVHLDKYDYTFSHYVNAKTKIKIYCNSCNEYFEQIPDDHLRGKGCARCSGNKKKTLEEFIRECDALHMGRYSYENTEYISREDYITIKCNSCEEETTLTANNHINGYGCKKCYPGFISPSRESVEGLETKKLSFIQECNFIHNFKYDYSLFEYKTSRTPSTIICPAHGEFLRDPYSHRKGYGCSLCVSNTSKGQSFWYEFLKEYGEVLVDTFPAFMDRKQIDLYLPAYNLAIEYNGVPGHHSSLDVKDFYARGYKDPFYHQTKYENCFKNNINLIHIFEFEDQLKWKRKLRLYLENPSKYLISFKNNKRLHRIDSKESLVFYGQSYIKVIKND